MIAAKTGSAEPIYVNPPLSASSQASHERLGSDTNFTLKLSVSVAPDPGP